VGAAVAVGLTVVVGLLGLLVVGLLRSHAEILRALHDLGVNLEDGAPTRPGRRAAVASRLGPTAPGVARPRATSGLSTAHDVSGQLPTGGAAHVAVVGAEHSTLLAFLSTGCGTCASFWEALSDADERALPGADTRVVIVTQGVETESEAAVAELAPVDVVTVMSSEAWDAYDVPVAPYFVLVDAAAGEVVGEGAGVSWRQVIELLGRSVDDQAVRDARARRLRGNGAERAEAIDEALLAAGIQPGDPSLYPTPSEDATP